MKTIEDKIQEILAEHHECRWMDSSELENCLRKIATEQKDIDIEKACEVYENELREIVRIVNALREGVGDCISIEGSVKDFRKAMEE